MAGLSVLRLILKNFGNVIKSNIEGPIQTVGVDISREERFVKLFFVFLLVVIFLVYVFRLVLDNFTGKCGLWSTCTQYLFIWVMHDSILISFIHSWKRCIFRHLFCCMMHLDVKKGDYYKMIGFIDIDALIGSVTDLSVGIYLICVLGAFCSFKPKICLKHKII